MKTVITVALIAIVSNTMSIVINYPDPVWLALSGVGVGIGIATIVFTTVAEVARKRLG